MAKIEYTGGHIGIMLIIEMAKIESTGGHIEIMLIIEITKIKLTGGHIEFMLIIFTIYNLQGCVPPLQEVALRVSLPSISVFGVSAPCGALDLDNIVSPPPHLSSS